jgi:hypothetical protein
VREAWSSTLREEHRQGFFENSVLRRIFGPKRVEVIQGSGKECMTMIFMSEHLDRYSGDKIKKIEMGRACSTYGGEGRRMLDVRGEI